MIGIVSCGSYIPRERLARSDIAKTWDLPSARGEKAVASYDEDSITMAVAAARNCLSGIDHDQVDDLFLATTTSPYRQKQASSLVAALEEAELGDKMLLSKKYIKDGEHFVECEIWTDNPK